MADLFDLGRNIGGSTAGPGSLNTEPGWLWRGAGRSGEWAAKQFTKAFPDAIAGALQKGIADGNLSGMLGEAFANAPFAAFKQKILDTFKNLGAEIAKSWDKADEAAFAYGKRIGLAGDQVARLRNEMIKFANTAQIGINYGKSIEEAIKLQGDYSAAVGRNIMMTNKQAESMMALSAVVGDDMAVKFSASLDKFGLSTESAGEMMTQMFNKSVKQGISLETYAKNVSDHLTMAQKYTFKNGINGLTSMAEKAAKLRVDMDMVAQMAEKMGTIGDSVNVASQLQVLGGPFTQFADPMKLLYGSLNDMEGLMDQLTNLTGSLGRFNRETGEIEIATFDKLRLKQAAQAMGVDYGKLIEQTTTQARRGEIEYQMRGLANIPDEYKELIMNTATFQNGVAGVRGENGEFKALSELGSGDLKSLIDYSKSDSENIRDIAQMLRGALTVKANEEKEKDNLRAQKYAQQAESIKNVYDMIGHNAEALNKLINIQIGSMVWQSLGAPIMSKVGGLAKGAIKMVTSVKEKGGIVRTHDDGGYISDGIPGKEMIMNSAQHGEFVVNKSAALMYLPLLRMLNGDKSGALLRGVYSNFGGINKRSLLNEFSGMHGIGPKTIDKLSSAIDNLSKGNNRALSKTLRRMEMSSLQRNALFLRHARMKSPDSKILQTLSKTADSLANTQSKVTGFVQKQVSRGIEFAGSKTGGKVIGAAGSIFAGIGAGISSWQQSKLTGENYMDKGRARGKAIGSAVGATAGFAAGAAAGAAIGGALGTAVPVIGNIVGALLGAVVGGVGGMVGKEIGNKAGGGSQVRRDRKFNEFASEMNHTEGSKKFSTLKGNFSVSEMRKIKDALNNDGVINKAEISEDLLKKINETGNGNLMKKGIFAKGGLLYGPSHANGGIKLFNEVEGGEFVINKFSTKNSIKTLSKINDGSLNDSNIKPIEPMGKQMKVNSANSGEKSESIKNINIKPIDINFNGSIKLENGGQTFDIMKELKENPIFVSKLVDIITKQININENMGFDKKTWSQKYTTW